MVAWAKLEHSINDLIWVINGKDLASGRFDTQDLDITKLLSALQKAISTNLPGPTFQGERKTITDIINAINEFKADRNAVVHGAWGRHNGTRHGVCSLRFETTGAEFVTFEEFTPSRMHAIEKVAIDAIKSSYSIIKRLEALRGKSAEPRQTGEANPPGDQQSPVD